jgi:excisionase family DNA binding protein
MVKEKEFYSVPELAKLLNVSRQAISDRIQRGTLKAIRFGAKIYAIPAKEVKRVIAQRKL